MSVVMTLPLVALFFLAQRTFVEGIKLGGSRDEGLAVQLQPVTEWSRLTR